MSSATDELIQLFRTASLPKLRELLSRGEREKSRSFYVIRQLMLAAQPDPCKHRWETLTSLSGPQVQRCLDCGKTLQIPET